MLRRQFVAVSTLGIGVLGFSPLVNGKLPKMPTASYRDQWPCWRGPHRNGYAAERAWPDSLDESHLKVQWSVALDAGYSGPIIESDSVIVTETLNREYEVVRSLDRATGTERWRQQWKGSMSVPFFAKANGDWIRATPASDGKQIYVGGMKDVLCSLSLKDGSETWKRDFPAEMSSSVPDFGMVCSPLIDGNVLYVQAAGGLVKLNTESGKVEWRVLNDGGGMNGSAFSSPVLAEIHGKRQLLVQTRTNLCSVDPEDGALLWKKEVEAFRGMNILTPTVWKDQVFTSSYGGKAWLFGFEPSTSGEWKVNKVWENKVQAYMSSPIIVNDVLYMHLRNQRFTAIEMQTGKELWTSRPYGKYWSLVTNGEKILALDETGMLYLIAPNEKELTILDERRVSEEECWAHLAVVDDQLIVRHLKGVTAFQWS